MACFTAENELDVGIEEFDGFGPLVGLLGVVFLCHLADLPGSVHLVSEGPIFDLTMLVMRVEEVRGDGVRYRASRGHFDDGGWRSMLVCRSCSTQPMRELRESVFGAERVMVRLTFIKST